MPESAYIAAGSPGGDIDSLPEATLVLRLFVRVARRFARKLA
ncbi:MAG: hypothetical protein ACYCTE_06780 [Acidimicrobiales bacterium]